MRAEIVSIGTELLLGDITDTNAAYLAQRLALLGIDCYYVSQVGDNLDRIVEVLRRAWERSDLTVTTGGLGPTQDDLTREAISALLGEPMEVQADLESELSAFFARRGVEMPQPNLKQATLVRSAKTIANPVGTAPGWWVRRSEGDVDRAIVSMPGVPYEMKRMWEREVEPDLRAASGSTIVSRTLKTLGLGESAVAEKVHDLLAGSNPTLAPYAKRDGVHLRITAKAQDSSTAERAIAELESEVRARLGDAIYGTGTDTPYDVVRRLLIDRGYVYTVLEVGPALTGSLSPLLGEPGAEPNGLAAGAVSVESLSAARKFMSADGAGEAITLQSAAAGIMQTLGADVVLAARAELAAGSGGTLPANTEAEILAITPNGAGESHVTRLRQTWRTESTEVRRLVGLAACNLLRLRLLKIRG